MIKRLDPGATVGVIGGGQLGRYFALKARQWGYAVWVLDPDANAPAMQIASVPLVAAYDDVEALKRLGEACDGVTIEFENVPADSLDLLQGMTQVAPSSPSVQLAQDRLLEKASAASSGLLPAPHAAIGCKGDVGIAIGQVQFPAILKTARLGYDGKGQATCHSAEEVLAGYNAFGQVDCVLEQRIELMAEISVVLARGFDGQCAVFPVAQNTHVNGILHTSVVPAVLGDELLAKACEQAETLAHDTEHVGVLAVEFFVASDSTLYFNEMAPRPHNSGHYTLDATVCSQFEQQLRVLCAQELGAVDLVSPVAMINLLGDLWEDGLPPFSAVLGAKNSQLHLYGKAQARPGRKMGHVNCLADSSGQAESQALELFAALSTSVS